MTPEDAPDREVALAEFNALRAEIISRITTQAALMTLVVTAIGLVAGFVIKAGDGKGPGDVRLLLILPFLVAGAGIYSSNQDHGIRLAGAYIRDVLWPAMAPPQGSFLSWERVMSDFRRSGGHRDKSVYLAFEFLAGIPGILIYGLGSIVPLFLVAFDGKAFDRIEYAVVWGIGAVLIAIYVMLAWSTRRLDKPLGQLLKTPGLPVE